MLVKIKFQSAKVHYYPSKDGKISKFFKKLNLKLHVDANNSGALRFYTNLGFNPIKSENGRIEMQKEILEKKLKK
mgnify:CR=1 FL=1